MEERTASYRVLVGKLEDLEEPGMDGRIKLRPVFRKWDGGHGLD
jgi:hypothetical protein